MFNQAVSFCVYMALPVENEPCLLLLSVCSVWASLIKFGFDSLMFYIQEATLWHGAWWIKRGTKAQQRKQGAMASGCRPPWVRWDVLGNVGLLKSNWGAMTTPCPHVTPKYGASGERVPSPSGAGSEMPPGPRGWEIRGIPGSNPQGTSISSSDCFLMAPELSKGNRATGWVCISFYLSF